MSEGIHAEFVGGPVDGQYWFLRSETNEVTVQELDQAIVDEQGNVKIANHKYIRRSINGIFVRSPSGAYLFDWKGIV